MKVLGFKMMLPAGWYSMVKDYMSYEDFLNRCKIVGLGGAKMGVSKMVDKAYKKVNNIRLVSYDDETGNSLFHFLKPVLFTDVPPLLLPSRVKQSSVELVFEETN